MSTKISEFVKILSVDDSGLLNVVQNGQNFSITQENYLAQFGVTGTIVQDGAVTGTPVLDKQGTVNNIRNIEDGPGVATSVSPENGITIEHNLISGTTGVPVFTDLAAAQPLIRSLLAGDNMSITPSGNGLRLDAVLGTVPNTVIVQSASDFPGAVLGVRTLLAATPTHWVIKGIIDLGTDVISMEGGHTITGDTSTLSGLTTNSALATITATNGGGKTSSVTATTSILINNTGSGASIKATGADTIFYGNRVEITDTGNGLEIEDALFVVIERWAITGGVNGVVLTGTANNGPIINSLNTVGLTGKGIYINGDIPVNGTPILISNTVLTLCTGNAIEIAAGKTVQGMSFVGGATSIAGNAMKIAGNLDGGLQLQSTNMLSLTQDAIDMTGSTIASIIASSAGISSVAAGKAAVKGDAGSANINSGGTAVFENCQINNIGDPTTDALSGITKKDLQYRFINAGPRITNSANIGTFTLDAQATTTFSNQGADGTITAFADSATSPGVETTVSSASTPASGASVAIYGTTSYNGLFTAANVIGGVSFDIVRVFVADDATGSWESGWEKIVGSTTFGDTIERFDLPNDNELRSLDAKTQPVTYNAIITGAKTGTGQNMEFALFHDSVDGNGFVKVNGSFPRTITTSSGSLTVRISTEAEESSLFTAYARNMDGTSSFICDALTTDIGIS